MWWAHNVKLNYITTWDDESFNKAFMFVITIVFEYGVSTLLNAAEQLLAISIPFFIKHIETKTKRPAFCTFIMEIFAFWVRWHFMAFLQVQSTIRQRLFM